jgi:aryl-alcohol dehydrogenase-like predicted oxidoreductase
MRPGYATAPATEAYAARHGAANRSGFYRTAQGLTVSSLGIGTYLGAKGEDTDRRYEDALAFAIDRGINFIDTSLNYRNTRSEQNIGRAIVNMPREELVVCTKAGYLIPGAVPPLGSADIVGGNHSIAPAFLRDQLVRSRANLGIATVDVFYLHNPETQLAHVQADEFDTRLTAAFEALEQLRSEGSIRFYGAATWDGFRKPGLLSITRMVAIARNVGGDGHGFRFIQLPLNLAMREAFVNNVTTEAESAGVTVVTSASILQSRLVPAGVQFAIQFARSTPGVTVSLVGMSRREHVEENLGVATVPPLSRDEYISVVEKL